MIKRILMNLLVWGLVLTACQEAPGNASGLSREQFIDLYVALRNAQSSARTPTEFEAEQKRIFEGAGATPQSLADFAAAHAGQVEYMSAVWDSIRNRLDRGPEATPQ